MKRSPQMARKLIALVRAGHSPTAAGHMLGLNRATVSRWRVDDRNLRNALKKAMALHERRLLSRIETASRDPKHWTAAAWILERRYPEKWALRLTRMLEQEREAMLAELRKTLDETTFGEVARALVAAQQNARGSGREQRRATH